MSNAEVSVRDTKGWHKAGYLSESRSTIDVSSYEHVLEIKLEWDGSEEPQIYEIIPVKAPQVESVADMKLLIDRLIAEGEFKEEKAVPSSLQQ